MGVIYAVFNHSKKEFVQPESLPVDRSDPVSHPFSAFLASLMLHDWRHDHVVIFDDSGDIQCDWTLSKVYKDRSVELWNGFVSMYGSLLPGLRPV
ncbi:MAG: hypothetical protein ISF22_01435 [Methanomassiliicoccus sp.]|nr:hypothetical protein [Methanomassiliicoccus sp.]